MCHCSISEKFNYEIIMTASQKNTKEDICMESKKMIYDFGCIMIKSEARIQHFIFQNSYFFQQLFFCIFKVMNIDIVITDLDGTLLNSKGIVSQTNLQTLNSLKKQEIIRVIATGRNLFSLKKVLPDDFPIDYVVFSSGCGIIDWKTKKIIFSGYINSENVESISKILLKHEVDFMCHRLVPDNHYFQYFHNGNHNPDFFRRIKLYNEFCQPTSTFIKQKASQFIAIFPELDSKFHNLKSLLYNLNVIKTTSPLDHKSIWMEIFHKDISKSQGCQRICDFLKINRKNTLSIGNDYNDLDLLEWSEHSFAVANAPDLLLEKFLTTCNNNENGFSEAIQKMQILR